MKTSDLQVGDVIKCANGKRRTINVGDLGKFKLYYDEDMNCLTNPEYTIIEVQRPYYNTMYSRNIYTKHK